MNPALADLIGRLEAAGRIGDDDVTALRGQVYATPQIDQDELAALLALDGACPARPVAWADFLADVMGDALLRQSEPQGYVDDAEAAWIMQAMGDAPTVDAALGALGRVIADADEVPLALETYALAKAKAAIAAAGAVRAADVELLRRLVFAGGGDGALGVTRAEADALFDINDTCHDAANDAGWADFFAKAVADSLTAVSPFQPVGRDQERQDEAWLNQRDTLGGFMAGMVKKPDLAGFARDIPEILDPFKTEAHEWDAAQAQMERDEAAAVDITDEEARWLVGRFSQGRLNDAERALIVALRDQAGQVSRLLQPLLEAAPAMAAPAASPSLQPAAAVAAPAIAPSYDAPAAPVFGHRKAMPG